MAGGVAWQQGALPPAPKAHLLLVLITVLPLTGLYVPYSVSVILHAAVTVYVGSWRSVKVRRIQLKQPQALLSGSRPLRVAAEDQTCSFQGIRSAPAVGEPATHMACPPSLLTAAKHARAAQTNQHTCGCPRRTWRPPRA